jgi:hypothetical protein
MTLSFIYLVFVSLLKLLVGSDRPAQVKDIELIVLRHQLDVLHRQVEHPRLRSSDRAFLAATSQSSERASSTRSYVSSSSTTTASVHTGRSVDVRPPCPSRYGRRHQTRRSSDEIDSVASCMSITGPQRDATGFWHPSRQTPAFAKRCGSVVREQPMWSPRAPRRTPRAHGGSGCASGCPPQAASPRPRG